MMMLITTNDRTSKNKHEQGNFFQNLQYVQSVYRTSTVKRPPIKYVKMPRTGFFSSFSKLNVNYT